MVRRAFTLSPLLEDNGKEKRERKRERENGGGRKGGGKKKKRRDAIAGRKKKGKKLFSRYFRRVITGNISVGLQKHHVPSCELLRDISDLLA